MDKDFFFVLDSLVLGLFEEFMFGHKKIVLLLLDVNVSIFPDGMENATIGVGQFGFDT